MPLPIIRFLRTHRVLTGLSIALAAAVTIGCDGPEKPSKMVQMRQQMAQQQQGQRAAQAPNK